MAKPDNEIKLTERKWGGKTALGDAAAQKSWNKNWMKNEPKEATFDRMDEARDEADAEAQRESTRGLPGKTKPMKNGGPVKSSASKRADGIAQRGKTKGKML